MIDFVKQLQREINRKIDKIERSDTDPINKAREGNHVMGEFFDRLKDFILDYTFRDEAEEIEFFKEVKPRIVCRLIYYRTIYNIEMSRPVTCAETQKKYLNSQLDAINHYSTKRLDFLKYFRAGSTHLDRLYFLRGQSDTEEYLEKYQQERDPKFSTNRDFIVAQILANDMVTAYLMTEIEKLEMERVKYIASPFPEPRLQWQESKTFLLELIYGWDTKRCFGDVPLTQVAYYISKVFNVNLETHNLSRAFADMKIRNNPISGLDSMSEELLKRMKRERKKTTY